MYKKSLGEKFDRKSFRLGDEHLAVLDQLDRSGEGRSAALRRLLERRPTLSAGDQKLIIRARSGELAAGSTG